EGLSGAESYRRAGYSAASHSAENSASRLMRIDEVKARLDELQGKTAARAEVTRDSLVADLEEARRIALSCNPPQSSAAIQATMGIARLTGMLIERRQIEVAHKPGLIGKMIELSEDEWLAQFAPRNSSGS